MRILDNFRDCYMPKMDLFTEIVTYYPNSSKDNEIFVLHITPGRRISTTDVAIQWNFHAIWPVAACRALVRVRCAQQGCYRQESLYASAENSLLAFKRSCTFVPHDDMSYFSRTVGVLWTVLLTIRWSSFYRTSWNDVDAILCHPILKTNITRSKHTS